ncbi:membrane protein insertase YidC, partial [Helicobacter pylori]|nr:membrane protein insertase YidC [Helicobacter pylori]
MDKNNNTNLILAIALSFLFIALYSYFFQKPNKTTTQTTKQETTNNHTATGPNAPNAFSATQTIPQENLLSTIS